MPETLASVMDWILSHSSEDDLEAVINCVKQRRKSLATMASMSLAPGAKVMIINIRPKVWEGLTGTFVEREGRGSRGSVMLDEASTQRLRRLDPIKFHGVPKDAKEYLVNGMPLQSLRLC
jgi:hypothetical protein